MSKRSILAILFSLLFSSLFVGVSYADGISESDPIYEKVFYKGVLTCYETTASEGGLKAEISLGEFDGSMSGFFEGYGYNRSIVKTIGNSQYAKISCGTLLTKKTAKKLNESITNNTSEKETRLTDALYTKQEATTGTGSSKTCYSYPYIKHIEKKKTGEVVTDEYHYSTKLCITKDSSGNYIASTEDIAGQNDYNHAGLVERKIISFKKLGETNKLRLEIDTDNTGFLGIYTYTYTNYNLSDYSSEDEILATVGNKIASVMGSTTGTSKVHNEDIVDVGEMDPSGYQPTETWRNTYYAACSNFVYYSDANGIGCTASSYTNTPEQFSVIFNNETSHETIYKKLATRNVNDYTSLISAYSNSNYSYSGIKFNDDEKYRLYQHYLTNIYEVSNINCSDTNLNGAGAYNARLWWSSESKYSTYCYFDVSDSKKSIKVNGVYDDGIFGKEMTLEEMIAALNGLTNTDAPGSSLSANTDWLVNDDEISLDSEVQTDPCYNAGLESMAWILCPTLNNTKNTVSVIDSLIASWLSVETNMYDTSSGAYTAWSYMRGIANVAVIIILLVIIVSQLTGYGIDNYGIKKMLPKLIVMAVLINLSFLVCQIMIDLSNILGSGLNQMFRTIGEGIISAYDAAHSGVNVGGLMEGFVGHVIAILFGAIGVAGAAAPLAISIIGIAGSEGAGAMIVVLIVLALLVVLAAVLLFFVMLGARMVMVIVCAAVAPIAFVCYILPNTKVVYNKWWSIFRTALIMFPICGAIGGVGYMIKAIVLTQPEAHIWMMVFAIIVPYLPMFLLPTLLKGAISGLGKVGATLTSLGSGLRANTKNATNAVRDTDAYKDRLQFAKDSSAAARAQRIHNQLSGRTNLTQAQRDRLRRADDTLLAHNKRLAENERRANGQYFSAMTEKQRIEATAEASAVERYNDADYSRAAEASIVSKAVDAATADQEALLTGSRAALNSGATVNTNDARSVGKYHSEALARYRAATTEAERNTAMAQVRAAQNILSKTDAGRAQVSANLSSAIRNGETAGLQDAASHLMNNFGDKYKSVDRGTHAMISDLATTDLTQDATRAANLAGLQAKIDQLDTSGAVVRSGEYSMKGTDKYTAETLVGADDAALDRFVASIQNGSLTGASLTDIQSTAYKALDMKRSGTLSMKPEVEKKLQQIVGNFVPSDIATERAAQDAASRAAQQQFDNMARNIDEINQQLHQHGPTNPGPSPDQSA